MAPKKVPSSKKQQLSLMQLASYDDILTDALVDHVYYWTTIPKNRSSYHPSRGIREEEITKIIQSEVVINKDPATAERKLLATTGLRKFHDGLKNDQTKADFRAHLLRYMSIYLPDCPFEVNTTNRYTIVSHEAAVTARRFIRCNETIKYLSGVQVLITPEEEREMTARKKDFSIIISARNKCSSLFMGPARFANHDCKANAKLVTTGQTGIEIIATTNINVGEEITVTYADSYFGEDNCECLCSTCEGNQTNGWTAEDSDGSVKKSIESGSTDGYSLRRRRRQDESTDQSSRTPSVTPDIRPRISKSRPARRSTHPRESAPTDLIASAPVLKKKRPFPGTLTPPITPAKKLKVSEVQSVPVALDLSSTRSSSSQSLRSNSLLSANGSSTDITEPEKSPAPAIYSPMPTRIPKEIPVLKQEDEELAGDVLAQTSPFSSTPKMTGLGLSPQQTPESSPNKAMSISSICNNISPPDSQDAAGTGVIAVAEPTAEAVSDPSPVVAKIETADQKVVTAPKQKRKYQKRTFVKETTPPARHRIPGDYTLTPLLLSEPETAWVKCLNCDKAFVQQNAYYTKSSCPRCERHSKLYGYIWPKTEKQGSRDAEERVLDHRTVRRFLNADDEARIRGRKRAAATLDPTAEEPETGAKTRAQVVGEAADSNGECGPRRRSGRVRRISSKEAAS